MKTLEEFNDKWNDTLSEMLIDFINIVAKNDNPSIDLRVYVDKDGKENEIVCKLHIHSVNGENIYE